jgi:hypothetical protein
MLIMLIAFGNRVTYHWPYIGAPLGVEVFDGGTTLDVVGVEFAGCTTGHPFEKERGFHPKIV